MHSGVDELWIISGKCDSINVTPVHTVVNNMDNGDVLPALHGLTGCDTTSNVGTKCAAFQAPMKRGYELLYSFGRPEISDLMILLAKFFLDECISKSSERSNFDDIRLKTYHQKSFQLDLEKLPLSSIYIHIKQAFGYMHRLSNLLK